MSGIKYDEGKLRYSLVPPGVLKELAKVFTYGANKYKPGGWKDVEPWRYEDALFRHLQDWREGIELDPESKLMHLSHALTNIAILIELTKKEIK
jgi:hypothetical protein